MPSHYYYHKNSVRYRGYSRRYYKRNAKKILRLLRNKYRTDPHFRRSKCLIARKISLRLVQAKCQLVARIKQRSRCLDCKRKFPPVCMDFDHRPGTKKFASISVMVRNYYVSFSALDKEIKKCDLVCACCHRLRTQKRRK